MDKQYEGVITRFLRDDERLVLSEEKEMPLVLEAKDAKDLNFLHQFLATHSQQLIKDMAKYGAVLLRGFEVKTDAEFEQTVLSIPEFQGISDAFMSENGRDLVANQQYVLHTNSVYKTGGTLYLGGFHTENYYSPDVPSYLCFACFQPSEAGGETGLINTQKIYNQFSELLQQKLEKQSFFVCKWSLTEVASRYALSEESIKKLCMDFNLPISSEGEEQFISMYKPSVLEHELTKEKALQINLFEIKTLNHELRQHFIKDYAGENWFWHRFFWRLPASVFNTIEYLATMFIALFHSPMKSLQIVRTKLHHFIANRKNPSQAPTKVGSCFTRDEVKQLAASMRTHYSSCLWQKGDVLLIDNKKVMHAGMPGKGSRLIRAMVCNPLQMNYSSSEAGLIPAIGRTTKSIGTFCRLG